MAGATRAETLPLAGATPTDRSPLAGAALTQRRSLAGAFAPGRRAASALALRAAAAATAAVFSVGAIAQETTRPFAAPATMNSAPPSGVASLGQVTLALGLVLAVIFVAAWLLRRVKGFGHKASGALEVLSDLPVGQKERAVLIRVGNQQVLIGVAPGRVTTLYVLAEPVSLAPTTTGPTGSDPSSPDRPNFKALLMKSLGK